MLVESVCKSLQTLAVAVASQNAVLLEGPIGSGKTSLVEHLAAVTGRRKPPQLLKVQLGDQTDSKVIKKWQVLLGWCVYKYQHSNIFAKGT